MAGEPAASKMKENKHILLLVPGFPADEGDSNCIPALQSLVRAMRRNAGDAKFSVISFQYPFRTEPYHWHGIPVYPCGGENRNRAGRLNTWYRAWRYAGSLHQKNPFTHIHSFWLNECTYLGQYLSSRWEVPLLASIMGQDARDDNRYLHRLNFSRISITAGSAFAADLFQSHQQVLVDAVIPIGLDIFEMPQPVENAQRDIDLLGVGALTSLKNYREFIAQVALLREKHPNIRAVIIGEGAERETLQSLISEKNVGDNIRLVGKLPREEVLAYMQRSRILLHPSRYESQGYVLLEALYYGMYAVHFPVGFQLDSPRLTACENSADMKVKLAQLLATGNDHRSILISSIDESAEQFLKFYD